MKLFTGTVTKTPTPKTAFVEVESYWMHPVYRKKKKITRSFACHDTVGVKVGDLVKIGESRPISAAKRFAVIEVVKKD